MSSAAPATTRSSALAERRYESIARERVEVLVVGWFVSRRDNAKARAEQERAEMDRRKSAERDARRVADREASMRGMAAAEEKRAAAPTFGTFVSSTGLSAGYAKATTALIARVAESAEDSAREDSRRVSCHGCSAPKGCCKITVRAFLHEAAPIAARLIAQNRDTPDLRRALEDTANEMESTPKGDYVRPCVFLDENERCTIYSSRPSECGTHFVFSDPAMCSSPDPNVRVVKLVTSLSETPPRMEAAFVADAGLRREDFVYEGVLPRMVLLCLEAWERRDYIDFLAARGRVAAERYLRVSA